MESQNSLGEPLSAAASAELLGQASQRTMNLEDTQVVAALANLDSFGTSSEELVSEGSGELSRQVRLLLSLCHPVQWAEPAGPAPAPTATSAPPSGSLPAQ